MEKKLRSLVVVQVIAIAAAGCASRTVKTDSFSEPDAKTPAAQADVTQNTDKKSDGEKAEANAEYHFTMAQAYVAAGNTDRAIEEYKLAAIYDAKSPLIQVRLASEYIKKGLLSEALETAKEAVRLDGQFVDARLILAGLYSASKDHESALAQYESVLKKDPKHEEAAVYRAQILMENEKPLKAAESLQAFVKRNPESAVSWYYLGRIQQSSDKAKDAEKSYKKAWDLKPGFTQAAMALGGLYETQGKNDKALETFRKTFDEGQDPAPAAKIATILLKQEKYKEALPYLQSVENLDPEDMNNRIKLGLVYMETKRYEDGIKVYQGILQKYPDSDRVHYYLGSLYEETQRIDLAISHLKKIGAESKLFGDAALHVAYLLKKIGRIDDSEKAIDDSIKQSPKIPSFHVFKASLLEDAKKESEAVRVLESARKGFPEDEKVNYYLGTLYDKTGRTEQSVEQMEKVLKINADNADALNFLGYTWTNLGVRLKEAEMMLKKAVALKPENGYIQDSWGWHLFVRGRVGESVRELEKAAKLKPKETVILDHLADAYLRSNLKDKAIEKYREAYQNADSEDDRSRIKKKIEGLEPSGRLPASVSADK